MVNTLPVLAFRLRAEGKKPGVRGQRPRLWVLGRTHLAEGRRRQGAQRRMRPTMVIVVLPTGRQGFGLAQIGKQLDVEQLVPQPAEEALLVAVRPWRSGGDVQGLHPGRPERIPCCTPVSDCQEAQLDTR